MNHNRDNQLTWAETVYVALENLGGTATLSKIYEEAENIRYARNLSWPEAAQASIRKGLEMNSSDSMAWDGQNDYFQNDRIGSGIWSIRNGVIENDADSPNKLNTTQKLLLTNARIGQGQYRKDLLELWDASCSISRLRHNSRILIASHIKPWKDSNHDERLDPYNGLLLLPTLDKLFDYGYISLNDEGSIIISKSIASNDYAILGINNKIKINLYSQNKKYLSFHRQEVFEKKFSTLH